MNVGTEHSSLPSTELRDFSDIGGGPPDLSVAWQAIYDRNT